MSYSHSIKADYANELQQAREHIDILNAEKNALKHMVLNQVLKSQEKITQQEETVSMQLSKSQSQRSLFIGSDGTPLQSAREQYYKPRHQSVAQIYEYNSNGNQQNQVEHLTQLIQRLRETVSELSEKNKNHTIQLSDYKDKIIKYEQLKAHVQSLVSDVSSLQDKIEAIEKEKEDLKLQFDIKNKLIRDLETKNKQFCDLLETNKVTMISFEEKFIDQQQQLIQYQQFNNQAFYSRNNSNNEGITFQENQISQEETEEMMMQKNIFLQFFFGGRHYQKRSLEGLFYENFCSLELFENLFNVRKLEELVLRLLRFNIDVMALCYQNIPIDYEKNSSRMSQRNILSTENQLQPLINVQVDYQEKAEQELKTSFSQVILTSDRNRQDGIELNNLINNHNNVKSSPYHQAQENQYRKQQWQQSNKKNEIQPSNIYQNIEGITTNNRDSELSENIEGKLSENNEGKLVEDKEYNFQQRDQSLQNNIDGQIISHTHSQISSKKQKRNEIDTNQLQKQLQEQISQQVQLAQQQQSLQQQLQQQILTQINFIPQLNQTILSSQQSLKIHHSPFNSYSADHSATNQPQPFFIPSSLNPQNTSPYCPPLYQPSQYSPQLISFSQDISQPYQQPQQLLLQQQAQKIQLQTQTPNKESNQNRQSIYSSPMNILFQDMPYSQVSSPLFSNGQFVLPQANENNSEIKSEKKIIEPINQDIKDNNVNKENKESVNNSINSKDGNNYQNNSIPKSSPNCTLSLQSSRQSPKNKSKNNSILRDSASRIRDALLKSKAKEIKDKHSNDLDELDKQLELMKSETK